jgi:hypothetical protein
MENRIIDTPTELDDRDLDLVSGGTSDGGGGGSFFLSSRGNTSQFGILNVSALNGNNILSGILGSTTG